MYANVDRLKIKMVYITTMELGKLKKKLGIGLGIRKSSQP